MCLKGYRLTVVLFSFGGEAGCKAPGRGESCVFSGCRLRTSGFSKCSGKGGPIGTQAAYMRHPCRNMPFSDVLSENCWNRNGTLRKSRCSPLGILKKHMTPLCPELYSRLGGSVYFCVLLRDACLELCKLME